MNQAANPTQQTQQASVRSLAAYKVGQVVNAVAAELEQGETKPPPRYTEATLIQDMERAWKFARTEEEKAMLRATEGIGTARTREPTLANLLKRQLLSSKKVGKAHQLISTPLGRDVIGRLPVFLTDVTTTAKWEKLLGAIEKGEIDAKVVLDSQVQYVKHVVDRAKGQIKHPGDPGG